MPRSRHNTGSSTLFYHVIDIWLESMIDYCEELLMSYDLR